MIEYTKEIVLCADNCGYACFMDKEHPLSHGTGRTYYHRHVASLKYGRWLTPEEQVHHMDGNKKNNHPDNLIVLSGSEHSLLHKGEIVEKECLYCKNSFLPQANRVKYCSISCVKSDRVKNKELTKEILDELIPQYSWVVLGSIFGYSDNGIKKRARALGCNIPKRR